MAHNHLGWHFLESLPALHNQLQTHHIPVGKFPRKGVPLEWGKNYVSFLCLGFTRSQQGTPCKPQPPCLFLQSEEPKETLHLAEAKDRGGQFGGLGHPPPKKMTWRMFYMVNEPSSFIHSLTHVFTQHIFTEGFLCALASGEEQQTGQSPCSVELIFLWGRLR